MSKRKEHKQAAIQALIEQIHIQKIAIEEKRQEVSTIDLKLSQFTTHYETFITELRKQRRDLEIRIRQVRNQIFSLESPQEETEEQGEFPMDAPPDVEPSILPEIDQRELIENNITQRKQEILHHFARFWHPDHLSQNENRHSDLMTQLNVIFTECQDTVDMLAALPWDSAWIDPGKDENPGAQWERLMEWQADLEIAAERVEERLARYQFDPFYRSLSEWEQYENKSDYFAQLAEDERKEIRQLEETFAILKEQLDELRRGSNSS